MASIRQSKFKHVYGKANKREECYECIRITKSTSDSSFCAVNPKFVAIITESAGGGSFIVLPIEKSGRVDTNYPLVSGHTGAVCDLQWCPHNDNIIASASDDCTVIIWQVPDGPVKESSEFEQLVVLQGHQRRVNLIQWHPTAANVLMSAGADNLIVVWNVEEANPLVTFSFDKVITSASFNYNGSLLALACKDSMIRIVNPRTGEVKAEAQCHEGAKPQQVVFLKDDRFFTTGFSKRSERQYGLWDMSDLSKPLAIDDIDTSNGIMFPFYDPDCSIIYLVGKGDSTVRYFEYDPSDSNIYYLNRFDTSDPQRGFAFMCKRGVNVGINEVARMYKLHNKNWCEVISFIVPRKSELFQDDLYPDTPGDQPALTAADWFAGSDLDPILISLKDSFQAKDKPVRRVVSSLGGNGGRPFGLRPTSMAVCNNLLSPMTDNSSACHAHEEVISKMQGEINRLNGIIEQLVSRVEALEKTPGQ